jgi:hypothetical protein
MSRSSGLGWVPPDARTSSMHATTRDRSAYRSPTMDRRRWFCAAEAKGKLAGTAYLKANCWLGWHRFDERFPLRSSDHGKLRDGRPELYTALCYALVGPISAKIEAIAGADGAPRMPRRIGPRCRPPSAAGRHTGSCRAADRWSAPFSTRSASAIVVLVVIVLFLGKVKVSQPNLTKTHDDCRFIPRPPLLHH